MSETTAAYPPEHSEYFSVYSALHDLMTGRDPEEIFGEAHGDISINDLKASYLKGGTQKKKVVNTQIAATSIITASLLTKIPLTPILYDPSITEAYQYPTVHDTETALSQVGNPRSEHPMDKVFSLLGPYYDEEIKAEPEVAQKVILGKLFRNVDTLNDVMPPYFSILRTTYYVNIINFPGALGHRYPPLEHFVEMVRNSKGILLRGASGDVFDFGAYRSVMTHFQYTLSLTDRGYKVSPPSYVREETARRRLILKQRIPTVTGCPAIVHLKHEGELQQDLVGTMLERVASSLY